MKYKLIKQNKKVNKFYIKNFIYIFFYNFFSYDDDIEFISTKIGSCRPLRSCGKKIVIK